MAANNRCKFSFPQAKAADRDKTSEPAAVSPDAGSNAAGRANEF
jgi:hypothetical protein